MNKPFKSIFLSILIILSTKVSAEISTTTSAILDSNLISYQIDKRFKVRHEELSTGGQYLANFTSFSAVKGQTITINSSNATSVSFILNGVPVTINSDNLNKSIKLDSIRNGQNMLNIATIEPKEAEIQLLIPYPTLIKGDAKQAGFSVKKLAQLDQFIDQQISNGFPGAVLIIVKDSEIIKQSAYGFQRKFDDQGKELTAKNNQPMRIDTLFDLASNTKMFATNFAIMQLVSQGRLEINQPISHYIPEYQGDGREEITVRDLLTHSAGYAPEVKFFDPENRLGADFYSQDPQKTKSLIVTKVPFIYPRTTKNIYSDTDYMLAGILIEKITGESLDKYAEKYIYSPLGLTHTTFNPLLHGFNAQQIAATEIEGNTRQGTLSFPNIRKTVLQGQVHDEKAFYSMGGVSGHAGLFSNAQELAILASVMLNKGGYNTTQLFTPQVIDQFTKPSDHDDTFGLGWRRAGNNSTSSSFGRLASPYAYGHTGWTGIDTVIDPMHHLIIILLTNKKHTKMVDKQTFFGDTFELGQYGAIINKVYEAMVQ